MIKEILFLLVGFLIACFVNASMLYNNCKDVLIVDLGDGQELICGITEID